MRPTASAAIVFAALAIAGSARAQDGGAPAMSSPASTAAAPAPATSRTIGLRAFGAFEFDLMRANVAFADELGSSKFATFGAGADVTGIWRGIFLRIDVSHVSKDGNRVFVDGSGQSVSLNVPMTVTMTPIDIGAGWRLERAGRRANGARRITPYAGAGLTELKYADTSSNSIAGEDVSQTYKGTFFLAGVDIAVTRVLTIGAEGVFRSVPITPGTNSVFHALGESNLGSGAVRITFGVKY